jgi:uncharacterized RDD family membrane protein YckC
MKLFRRAILAAVLAFGCVSAASAQPVDINVHFSDPSLHIGQDLTLKQGDVAREAVVIAGDATIDGTIDRDLVVVLGQVQVSSTAVIGGSLIVIGGNVKVAEGAKVNEDIFVIGGYDAAVSFAPGGGHIVIGTSGLGSGLRGLVPWLMGGLLLARPIVPSLWWVWTVAAVFFFINLILNLLFDTPIRASTATLRATPLSTFMTGLLVMLLAGPVCVLLAVSVIGVAVVPFFLCALLIGTLLGKIAFARWIGMSMIHQDDPADRRQSLRSFLIGSAVMCIAYMIPIIGFVTWAMAGVFGLGAATMAFGSAYRREHPKKPKPPKPAAPVADVPPMTGVPPVAAATMMADEPVAEPPLAMASVEPVIVAEPDPAADPAQTGTLRSLLSLPRGPFMDRLGAFVLDFILIVIVAQALDLDRGFDGPLGRLGLLLAVVYHVGFWTWKQTTVGGIICNLRVVRTDGEPLQFGEALVRGLTGIFSLAVAGIGFLWILRDPERQAWHDRVAGTYVVKVPRSYPI